MNIEITDLDNILDYLETTSLEPHDDYSSEFTYKEQKILYKYIKQLQQENKQLKECYCNRTDCSGRIKNSREYDSLYQKYNKQLDNWNYIKKAAKNHSDIKKKCYNGGLWFEIDDLLNKMQELEQGSDSNE